MECMHVHWICQLTFLDIAIFPNVFIRRMCAHLPQISVAHDGQYNMMGSQLCCYKYKYIALLMSDFQV